MDDDLEPGTMIVLFTWSKWMSHEDSEERAELSKDVAQTLKLYDIKVHMPYMLLAV